ncbi:MAG: hypothetical protein EBZ77_11650 [Chitinophagia bacterium]|nr:hypothetical protein [Chitinophagia bacterium]
MSDVNFEQLFNNLKTSVVKLAGETAGNYATNAIAESHELLDQMKKDLKMWTIQLAAGALSKDDLADLLAGQKDLLKITVLTQAGMAAAAADKFKDDLFHLLTSSLLAAI